MPGHPLLKKAKAADFALFGATWWPEAEWERLEIATYLAVWVTCSTVHYASCYVYCLPSHVV